MIEGVIKKGFELFKKDYVVLILGALVGLLMMVFIITIPPMVFGIYYMCVQLMNGKKVQVSDVFKGFNYFFTSWGLFIVAFLAIAVGLVLLVIPGLILIVLYQYAVAFAIMENRGAVDSLKRSFAVGKQNFVFSIIFLIIMAVISGIGSVTRIGTLLTIPFTTLCTCVAASMLISKKEEKKVKKKMK